MSKDVYPFRVAPERVISGSQPSTYIRHADAGSAGVGPIDTDQKANVAKSSIEAVGTLIRDAKGAVSAPFATGW